MEHREFSVGRSLIAAVVVSPIAGFLGSLIFGILLATGTGSTGGGAGIVAGLLFFAFFATIVSMGVIFVGLLMVGAPLTFLLRRSPLPPIARDAILVAVAVAIGAAALAMAGTSIHADSSDSVLGWVVMIWSTTTALCWVLMVRYLTRPDPRVAEGIEERFR